MCVCVRVVQKIKEIFLKQEKFSHICKLCTVFEFIAKIIFNPRKIFVLCSKWRQIKKSAPGLSRGLSSNFWWLRIEQHERFIDECGMSTEKYDLVLKKNLYK